MRRILFGFLLAVSNTALAADHWVTGVTASVSGTDRIESISSASYVDENGNDAWGTVWGKHCLDAPQFIGTPTFASYCVNFERFHAGYSGYFNIYAEPGCHTAELFAHYSPLLGIIGDPHEDSAQACINQPPPPLLDPPDPALQCSNYEYTSPCSPLIINFATGDYDLSGQNDPVLFDITASGSPSRIGWTAAGADEAFLWLDRNGNGSVDSGAELFGTATPLRNGGTAKNGFEALRELDSNFDGKVDELDSMWPLLMLWRDLNHNGVSELREIAQVASSQIVGLELRYQWTGRHDRWGNAFRYLSQVWLKGNASPQQVRSKTYYDIYFVSVP